MPIYASTAFVFEDAQEAADLFALQNFGNIYSRISNPTNAAFEERVASLEGGLGGLAAASGMSAQLVALLTLATAGDHFVSSNALYGGTFTQLDVTMRRLGIDVTFVDFAEPDAVEAAIGPTTKAIFAETIGNPGCTVLDVAHFAEMAHAHDIPLVVDNTFATPYLCRPIEWGADIVTHSATKFIGGHGAVLGGVIVESGLFPFDNGRFPVLSEPSPAYHDLNFWENFREYGYLMRARAEVMRDVGAAMSPFNAFLLLIGLETLSLRMQRHVDNAAVVARFLRDHPAVAWIRYPIFDDNPWVGLAEKYLPDGPGAVFTFGIEGGYEAGVKFIAGVELASHLANVGDAKTLVIHPASTTHQQVPHADRDAMGIGDDMIRISVGIESVDDIVDDLDRALRASR
jgi:O-acetylhomoserine (thiol)-lyase